ncbi:hypothetical protein NWQ33_00565 [Mycoplasmopsis cynos]|nr:hypothetical protein [Mycoplasmopsis cynos]
MTNSSLNFLTSKKNLEELMSIAKPVTSLNKYKKGIYLIVIGEVFYIAKTNSKKGFISRFYTHNSNLRKYKSDLETYGLIWGSV